jgi:hypothetical protein
MKMSYAMHSFIEEVVVPLGIICVGTLLFLALICTAVGAIDARSCSIYAQETGTPTHYRWFDECYIQTSQGSMPWSEFKARAYTRESGAK